MILCVVIPLVFFVVGKALSWRSFSSHDKEKRSPYECGFAPFGSPRVSFSIYFFLLCILFLVFDVEIVLLLPLPFVWSSHPVVSVSLWWFLIILIVGFYHEWREGSLDFPEF